QRIASKICGCSASTTATPKATRMRWISEPVAIPRLAAIPVLGPPCNPCPSTYIMSLPGVRLSASAAARKTVRSAGSMGIERHPQRQEIAPGQPLIGRLAQQIGGVERWKQRHLSVAEIEVEPLAAQLDYAV